MSDNILVTRSSMPSLDEYIEEIRPIWQSHWLTNMGAKHQQLQAELEEYLGVPHVALYTNGHLALENAIAALNLPEGGEVITTPFTFASTTHAIVRNGLVPVFCDVNDKDYTMDVTKIEGLITDRTVAIVPVHVYGNICDVEAIETIAKKYGLKVIYDAAHAFAVKYKGMSTACFGDASMFSFHATKVFNTIEGGAVCFKDDSWVQLLNDQKNFGIHGPESVCFVGGNAKMNEFQAAMGICNLRHLDEEIAKRKKVVERYRERLSGVEGIKLSAIQENVESNYAYFPVVFDGYKYTRNEIYEMLQEQGITARKYFYPLTNSFECYRNYPTAGTEKTPVAQHLALRVLTLPLYADLSLEDVDRICNVIIGKKITSKIDVCMKAFHARLSIMNETMAFSFIKDDKEWNLEIPILNVDTEELKQFLLGKICFLDFLCLAAFNMSVDINTIPTAEQFMDVFETWDKYSNQIGYVEDKYTINIPDQEIKETLKEEGVVWYYGMSCSGKTYMGIKELNSYPIIKVAYNPCFSSDEEYALIKLLMYCGRNIAILLDDLQCDTEKTEELFKIIAEKKDTLKNRNIHIFMVSWVSLLTNEKVAGYQSVFKAFQVNTDRYIAQLQREIGDKKLRKICGKNLALLNSAAKYCEKNLGEPEKELFETFVKTNDAQKIESIYRLCVLGSFEYLVPKDFVEASVLSKELTTIKAVGTTYYVGHKEICRFLYLYIEKNKNALKINSLPAIDKIILDYIQEQEPGKQWRAIRQLIGEHGEEKLQSISLIWSGLSCFETAIKIKPE